MKFKSFIAEAFKKLKISEPVELVDPDTKKVTHAYLEFTYRVAPHEYEGGRLFASGGPELDSVNVKPFTFRGKSYSKVTADLIPFIEFHPSFEKKWKDEIEEAKEGIKERAKKVLDEYELFLFDHATEDVDIPRQDYKRTS